VNFYNKGVVATALPDFNIYFTLNYNTSSAKEVEVTVHNGVGTFSFNSTNYISANNLILGSAGSLYDSDRTYYASYDYIVPPEEIPTK
jgi:hypothetical protein